MKLLAARDHLHRFVNLDLSHSGSGSDCLVFCVSEFLQKFKEENLLHLGLALHGNSTFIGSMHAATLHKIVSTGNEGMHNFSIHSCALVLNTPLMFDSKIEHS